MKIAISLSLTVLFTYTLVAQKIGKQFPPWQEGEMEIHHIYTGKGEAVYSVFPDGTTMLIDAGDCGTSSDPRVTQVAPDTSRNTGEWIARYIIGHLPFKNKKQIDYCLLTHFHNDHMGNPSQGSPRTIKGGNYLLSGITEVYEHIPILKMVDRDWPLYKYPDLKYGKSFENYHRFVKWNNENAGMKIEKFIPGSDKQFSLVNHKEKFSNLFEVRNIVANGEVWTGKGTETKKYFPAIFREGQTISENKCSAGIRISYGEFDYFNGGDLSGRGYLGTETWRDIETPVGKAVGRIEVCEANHHAWIDAMNESFVQSTSPRVFIIQVWHVTHLNLVTLQTMYSKVLYPGERIVVPTYIPKISKDYIGAQNVNQLSGNGGHVVVKVGKEGREFKVFILDVESCLIKNVFGPYKCN